MFILEALFLTEGGKHTFFQAMRWQVLVLGFVTKKEVLSGASAVGLDVYKPHISGFACSPCSGSILPRC